MWWITFKLRYFIFSSGFVKVLLERVWTLNFLILLGAYISPTWTMFCYIGCGVCTEHSWRKPKLETTWNLHKYDQKKKSCISFTGFRISLPVSVKFSENTTLLWKKIILLREGAGLKCRGMSFNSVLCWIPGMAHRTFNFCNSIPRWWKGN